MKVLEVLRSRRYSTSTEERLQRGIAQVLTEEGFAFVREAPLSAKDRVDFLVDGGIAIEVKRDGSLTEITRQVHRYAAHDAVTAIVLVTTRMRHAALPASLNGKPVHVLHLLGSAF